jgi:surface antigen
MKYVIVLVLFLVPILLYPVRAREVSTDAFIIEYEPMKVFSTRSQFVPGEIKRRMPVEHYEFTNTPVIPLKNETLQPKEVTIQPFVIPKIVTSMTKQLKTMLTTVHAKYISAISSVVLQAEKYFSKGEVKSATIEKPNNKKPSKPNQKPDFSSLPELQTVNGLNSRFTGDPYSNTIPEKAKEVYTWDRLWNPAYNPQHYLQCTTYVAMIYNLNGISLHGKVAGDAREWIQFTDTFEVFENGKTETKPEVMDIAVWAKDGANHVGVITAVNESSVTIINANAEETSYTYTLSVNDESLVSLSGNTNWVPSHWMRVKP